MRVLATRQQHVRRQRQDVHHKTALALVRASDTISVEAIQPANLSRRPAPKPDKHGGYEHNGASQQAGLNKSLQDAGWRQFLAILACTPACAGKRVEAVPPADTTQDCSHVLADGTRCGGERVRKRLSVRTHVCPRCGSILDILDRDEHAATNIVWRGQRLRGVLAVAGALNREPVGL